MKIKHRRLFTVLELLLILLSLPLGILLVKEGVSFISKALGTKANLTIDLNQVSIVAEDPWRNLAQGGEEKGNYLKPVIPYLKNLKPNYIRIDHVYDFYNVVARNQDGSIALNWEDLDSLIEDILSTGAKPFFSLSYMPAALSKEEGSFLPKNWDEWEYVVQKTVEHYSGVSNLAISDVYYEVWNEPDLFGGFKTYSEKNYLDLYYYSARGAQKSENVMPFKIGGPATTKLYKGWFDNLLTYTQKNGLRIDFYSWHKYSKDLSDYEKDISQVKKWIRDSYPNYSNLELIISEVGPTTEIDPIYDQDFSAIHTLAVSTVIDGETVKGFTFEIKDGPGSTKYWGRWGILTHENFAGSEPKPRYKALEFLNKMQGKRVLVTGQGSWVKALSRLDGNTLRLFVVNYDPDTSHFEAVPLTFVNLLSRDFLFRRTDFQGKVREVKVSSDSGTWKTLELFSPNQAAIFEIEAL